MTQPTRRTRLYNFTEYATANPGAPFNPAYADAEENADVSTINQLCTNIGLIQRDDGALKNQSVHQDAFSTAALALIASDWTPRGLWLTATAYVVGDVVQSSTASYVCATAHTSGTFNTDYTAGKWVILGATATTTASGVSNTPAGNIAATNVQDALNELDGEKAPLAGSSSQLFSIAAATGANHAPRASQVQNNSLWFAAAAGTADAMTATISTGAITALVDGFEVCIRAVGANTLTNPTLNLTLGSTATGALTIVDGITGSAVAVGAIASATHELRLRYQSTGTTWALLNPYPVNAVATAILKAVLTAAGDILYATGASTPARLAIGTARQSLMVNAGATAPAWSDAITLTATQDSTSGTALDFTGIPSGVKQIVVMFNGVSTNGTSNYRIQLGDSGGVETSGYSGQVQAGNSVASFTSGFEMDFGSASAVLYGALTLNLMDTSNTWVATGGFSSPVTSANIRYVTGIKQTSSTLDRVRVTSATPDTFDAGKISISYS